MTDAATYAAPPGGAHVSTAIVAEFHALIGQDQSGVRTRCRPLRHAPLGTATADTAAGRRAPSPGEPLRHHAMVLRALAVVLVLAVSATGVWTVLGAARFSMDGGNAPLRELPAGLWFLLAMSVASFLLLTLGFLLRRS